MKIWINIQKIFSGDAKCKFKTKYCLLFNPKPLSVGHLAWSDKKLVKKLEFLLAAHNEEVV